MIAPPFGIAAICTALAASGVGPPQVRHNVASEATRGNAQQPMNKSAGKPGIKGHRETPDDEFQPVPRAGRRITPAVRWTRGTHVSVQVNVDGTGSNIVGDAANEPSIAVDPSNPARMAIGWRQFDTISSNFRQAGWGFTADAGATWTFPGVIEPGVFRSDPVLASDTSGNFYYNSLTASGSDFWCNVFKSTDGGASWDSGVYAFGGDKQWMVVDLTNGIGRDNIYAYWTRFYTCPGCNGHFTRSYDQGQTFLPVIDVPGNPYWGTLAVGPDGELYVAGDGFIVAKSTTMKNELMPPQFDFVTTVDLDGSMGFSGGPNPGGLLGQVWVAVDGSDGPFRGYVYLLCSVQRSSTTDPLDVMLARSVDGGVTWSTPVRVNDDPPGNGAYQWFGTMSVAPNGRIDVIWNDTRNDPGGFDSELYYAFSTDAGATWSVNEPLSPPFDPHLGWPQQSKMGDYFDMVSDELGANLAYAATFNGEQDVYYIRIGSPLCDDLGTVELSRAYYSCQSNATVAVVDCGLNADDNTVESVTVDVDSTSEVGVEQITLTETAAATARFEGSIDLSTTDSAGALLVAPGDLVTVTYIDADDGQGGAGVVVTDDAIVDCAPPLIFNVQTSSIGASSATVSFQTDEPTACAVHFGLACGALDRTATSAGRSTTHAINLLGLQKNTTYSYAVECTDEAGNLTTDDAGGSCYVFTTPDAPDYFTESFSTGGFDLVGVSLTFTPDGSLGYYNACAEDITGFPVNPVGGTTIFPGEDGYVRIDLTGGAFVSLYGVDYTVFYVGSNGYITFESGDGDWTPSLADHFSLPRISVQFNDFSPQNGGIVSWAQLADRIVVTYQNVPEFSDVGANNFQVEMRFDGTIVLSYLGMTATDGLVGLSAGGGVPADFIEADLSSETGCAVNPPALAPAPHDRRKNRYVSFAPNNAEPVAFLVELLDGPGAIGPLGWVGEPDLNNVSRVLDTAYFSAGWPRVVHVGDCEIVPVATYAILATGDGVVFADPLVVETIRKPGTWYYGDTVGEGTGDLPPLFGFTPPNGVVNVVDIQAYVLTAQGDSSPNAHTTWVDLQGLGIGNPPNYILNVSDLQRIKFGLQGQQYTDAPDQLDPADCP
ncbi:MAG: hypothetical protein ACE5HE_02515 [Phycisphaerae bacterium]